MKADLQNTKYINIIKTYCTASYIYSLLSFIFWAIHCGNVINPMLEIQFL